MEEAITSFNHAINLRPRSARAFLARGMALVSIENHEAAIADFTRAVKLDPGNVEYLLHRSRGNMALTRWGEVLADADRAITLKPGSLSARVVKAHALKHLGDLPRFGLEVLAILQEDPSYLDNLLEQAWGKVESGDFAGAVSDYDDALLFSAENSGVWFNRGLAVYRTGDLSRSLSDIDEAIRLAPDVAEYYSIRGSMRNLSRDLDGALADLSRVVEISPETASAYAERGKLRLLMGDPDGAESDFTAAFERDTDASGFLFLLAATRYFKTDFRSALKDFERLLKRDDYRDDENTRVYHYLTRDALGEGLIGLAELRSFLERRPGANQDDWYNSLVGYFQGDLTEHEVLSGTLRSGGLSAARNNQSLAPFFMAQKKLINNDPAGARELLLKVTDTRLEGALEFPGASIQLARLAK
jgi:tetratricopeptide (TPR) repeat protein